jgi:hypothetical protein
LNKDLNFEYVEEFADYIIKRVEKEDGLFLTVVGKFEEIKAVFREVMLYEFVNFESLQLESPMVDDYIDEFVLSLWMNDEILEIGCEKLKDKDGKYTNPCGDETYLFDNCSSKLIHICEGSELYFVSVEDESGCDKDSCCEDCCAEDCLYD